MSTLNFFQVSPASGKSRARDPRSQAQLTRAVWTPVLNNAAYAINPVNWRTDAVPATFEYKGQALSVSLDTTSMTLVVSRFDEPEPTFKPVWPSGCLHFYEIQFYNRFLRANALLRCSTSTSHR